MDKHGQPWFNSQLISIDTERWVTAALFGITLWGGVSNKWLVLVGFVLVITSHVRSRAINLADEQRARRRIFQTNPIIENGSVVIVLSTVATVVRQHRPNIIADPIIAYSVTVGTLGILILLIERFSTGEYFAWWGERALENAEPDMDKFWTFIAAWCFKLSAREFSRKEVRRIRSRQRHLPETFNPIGLKRNPPTPERSWILTFAGWLVSVGRALVFVVGFTILTVVGYNGVTAVALTVFVLFTSSFLADQIKYIYFYQLLRDGFKTVSADDTMPERFIQMSREYWIATLLSFGIILTKF